MDNMQVVVSGVRLASPVETPDDERFYAVDFATTEATPNIPRNAFTIIMKSVDSLKIGAIYDLGFTPGAAPKASKAGR